MRTPFLVAACCGIFTAVGQSAWLQKADYSIRVELFPEDHRLLGSEEINYTNHSPDTLYNLYFHLYYNAFQPGSAMDVRQPLLPDPDKRIGDRIAELKRKEVGSQRISNFLVNGVLQEIEEEGTVLEVRLTEPVLPGTSVRIQLDFDAQIPVQIRRTGRDNSEGIDYTMTQWYPKLAEYDEDGWHANPYVAREFYGVWSNFDVHITAPAEYLLGGTGVVMNPGETGHGYGNGETPEEGKITWHFRAERVHDFAWAADTEYKHLVLPAEEDCPELHLLYTETANEEIWEKTLPGRAQEFFRFMSKRFGPYPYPQFSLIQGGDGGMEYPMCTMMLGNGREEGIVGLFAHEAAHSWFYGVTGSDEFRYPWMDEGFTSFAESEVVAHLYGVDPALAHEGAIRALRAVQVSENREPLSTPADFFETNRRYGLSAYSSGEALLIQLREVVGEEAFNRGMLRYYKTWGFDHPDPWDFLRVMERTSGLELDWFLQQWVYTLRVLDYSIKEVRAEGRGNTRITLGRENTLFMPVEVEITLVSGGTVTWSIPLDVMRGSRPDAANVAPDWTWTHPEYVLSLPLPYKEIRSVRINPRGALADVNPENDRWEAGEP